ncbi:hypothetical protein Nepgr_010395 [Nepenthes gracilis]|uniref:Uncharacterized protein n=1 Tax=Nepenthes gracilis TaxID=150966 RepID=A0AAD3SCD7_NEPGR|nr:hypothetical protein Nepgr_010395 [Nepenthes gracilis]
MRLPRNGRSAGETSQWRDNQRCQPRFRQLPTGNPPIPAQGGDQVCRQHLEVCLPPQNDSQHADNRRERSAANEP